MLGIECGLIDLEGYVHLEKAGGVGHCYPFS
jgi:hypothetical protein